jgi:N-acetyl-anhydromuramyl-L-alanine amidase AmpD
VNLAAIPKIQARHYTDTGPAGRLIDLLVVHTMESPEKPSAAEDVAKWFAGRSAPQASAHYCIDNNSIVRCVDDADVAWHAPGVNHNGIGLEHAGRAAQALKDWGDAYSVAELVLSARLSAALCRAYRIPVVYLRAPDLVAGRRGITSHREASAAFRLSDHTDPGLYFPIDFYLSTIKRELALGEQPAPAPPLKPPPPTLRLGSKGWQVKQLQRLLNFEPSGHDVNVDGTFSRAVEAEVKAFQKAAGLRPDGVVGPNTWHALWVARYRWRP